MGVNAGQVVCIYPALRFVSLSSTVSNQLADEISLSLPGFTMVSTSMERVIRLSLFNQSGGQSRFDPSGKNIV